MKKIMIMAMMMAMTIAANAMSYKVARNEALFLSDKMAYELKLTDAQYDAVYEINLDYLMSVNGPNDVYGIWWKRRNADLRYVLTRWQYEKYLDLEHFYRPLSWNKRSKDLTLNIYSRYTNRKHYYNARPNVYASYKGGNNRKTERYYADRWEPRNDPRGPMAPRPDGAGPRPQDNPAWKNQGNQRPVAAPAPNDRPKDNRRMETRSNSNTPTIISVGRK